MFILNKEDVQLLKHMYNQGYSQKQLELVFKTSKSTVHRIVKNKT